MERLNSCVACNRSVLRRRNHPLTVVFLEIYPEHAVLLLKEIISYEVPFDGLRSICHACWVRLGRDVHRQRDQQVQDQPPERREDQPNQQDQGPSNQQGEQEVYNDGQDVRPGFMSLQGYSRASNTARRCIFNGCRNTSSHLVPTLINIKFYLLNTNKCYIPQIACVCHPHMVRNYWEELSAQTPLLDFNNVHVLDMLELFKWG